MKRASWPGGSQSSSEGGQEELLGGVGGAEGLGAPCGHPGSRSSLGFVYGEELIAGSSHRPILAHHQQLREYRGVLNALVVAVFHNRGPRVTLARFRPTLRGVREATIREGTSVSG